MEFVTTEKIAEKLLRKSKLSTLYDTCNNPRIQQEILKQYQKLLNEDRINDKTIVYQNRNYIYPSIAVYHSFQKYGYQKKEVSQWIETEILATGKGIAQFLTKIGRFKFFFPLFKKMCFLSTKTSYKQPYFDMRWTEQDKDKIAWDCCKCHYFDELSRHQCPELTKIFCRLDDVMYGNIPTAEWARTQTIGDGGKVCDFCFHKIGGKFK